MEVKQALKELKEHIPFTVFAVGVAVLIVLFIHYLLKQEIGKEVFHFFHFLHVIVSAMATGAIYYKYRPSVLAAFFVGIAGAVIIGSLSDVILPYLGGLVLNIHIHFHLPLIEETLQTLLFASLGGILGVTIQVSKTPHFIHVFLSVFASLFYILAFSTVFAPVYFLASFLIVFIAVIIPCCLSDIVFPFLFLKREKKNTLQ